MREPSHKPLRLLTPMVFLLTGGGVFVGCEKPTPVPSAPMQLSTQHEFLPDASAFSDVLGPELKAPSAIDEAVLTFRVVRLPDLKLPSGRIAASDGFIPVGAKPFTQATLPGVYPLLLAIAVIGDDERIGFAKLQLADQPATRWEMALVSGQDPASLKPLEVFGYPVDSGTGCLGDIDALKLLGSTNEDFSNNMLDEFQKSYRHTRGWLSVDSSRGSVALFSSGFGDGVYPSYFGYSAKGELVSLITDFGVVKWSESQP